MIDINEPHLYSAALFLYYHGDLLEAPQYFRILFFIIGDSGSAKVKPVVNG